MGIQLVNQSDHDFDLDKWAHVLTVQANIAASAWRIKTLAVSVHHHPTWDVAYLVDTIPEAPGALAYHDVDQHGKPYMRIGVDTTLDAGEDVLVSLSHEVLELLVDPFCQLWAYDPHRQGLLAYEACDPVQSQSYKIDGLDVSNYVLPGWFGAGGPNDYLGHVRSPFVIADGGYAIFMRGSTVSEITSPAGSKAMAAKLNGGSHGRSWWRCVQGAVALGG